MRFLTVIAPPILAAALAAPVAAEQPNGRAAANFRLMSADGRPVSLADFKGRMVVLEWNNPGCPFVQKHYASGNMQATQARAKAAGAVWLTINSGAPGKQGYMTSAEAKTFVAREKAQPTAYLLDPKGTVGRGYAAKTTPHMYVIAPDGRMVYQGAIDDKPTANPADIKSAKNLIIAAVDDVKAGRPVVTAQSQPYGCAVKYAS